MLLYPIFGFVVNAEFLISISILIFVTVLTFTNLKWGIRFVFLILVISSFHLLSFSPTKFGFKIVFLSVSLEYLFLAILNYVINEKYLFPFLREIIHGNQTKESIQEEKKANINLFKQRFIKKSTIELEKNVTENKLVLSALSAAKEILEERKNAN